MANPLMAITRSAATQGSGMNIGVIQQMQQMMNAFRAMKDPQQALIQAAQQNPDNAAIIQAANGGNPVEIFREECMKHGKDPEQMMKALGLTPPKGC